MPHILIWGPPVLFLTVLCLSVNRLGGIWEAHDRQQKKDGVE